MRPLSDLYKFGGYEPDAPDLFTDSSNAVLNVIPQEDYYTPFPSFQANTDALPTACLGAFSYRDTSGSVHYFAGTQTKLYKLNGSTWDDVTRASGGDYTTNSDGEWRFTAYGDRIIATNYVDDIQSYIIGSSTEFAALSGDAPKAKGLSIINNFVVSFNTSDSDGVLPYKVRWSALDNPTSWLPSAATQADSQQVVGNGGAIAAIVGTQNTGIIVMDNNIWRMEYVGSPVIFNFTLAEDNRGTAAAGSVVSDGANVYYLGRDGFYMFNGNQSVPIGYGRVDKYFYSRVNGSYMNRIQAAVDLRRRIVMWAYPGPQSDDGRPNYVLVYSWASNRWAEVELASPIDTIIPAYTVGLTLEELGTAYPIIEDVPFSFDSPVWQGGQLLMAAIGSGGRLGFFSGENMEAQITTTEGQPNPEGRSRVMFCMPVTNAQTCTVAVGYRNLQRETETWSADVAPENTTGEAPFNIDSRYFRARVTIPAGETWTTAQGVRFRAKASGWK